MGYPDCLDHAVIDWGDGSEPDLVTCAYPSICQISHTYANADDYNVTVTAFDDCNNQNITVLPVTIGCASTCYPPFATPILNVYYLQIDNTHLDIILSDLTTDNTGAPCAKEILLTDGVNPQINIPYGNDPLKVIHLTYPDTSQYSGSLLIFAHDQTGQTCTSFSNQFIQNNPNCNFCNGDFNFDVILDYQTRTVTAYYTINSPPSCTDSMLIDWGDGSTPAFILNNGIFPNLQHTYPGDGPYVITIWLSSACEYYFAEKFPQPPITFQPCPSCVPSNVGSVIYDSENQTLIPRDIDFNFLASVNQVIWDNVIIFTNDNHCLRTVTIDWGDGNVTPAIDIMLTPRPYSSPNANPFLHSYLAPGTYNATVTFRDQCGNVAWQIPQTYIIS